MTRHQFVMEPHDEQLVSASPEIKPAKPYVARVSGVFYLLVVKIRVYIKNLTTSS